MDHPLISLATLAIRHLPEIQDPKSKASILDAAATIFSTEGHPKRAEQLATTASLIREAEEAQLSLLHLF